MTTREPLDPRLEDLWNRAKAGEADDLARLADREGSVGLEERGQDPANRMTALRAMGYTGDLQALPWLADVASSGSDDEAEAALSNAEEIAAAPRRSVDPEDALEVREGCDKLLALVKAAPRPRGRRVRALRVVRMLTDRGCGNPRDLPTDMDAK